MHHRATRLAAAAFLLSVLAVPGRGEEARQPYPGALSAVEFIKDRDVYGRHGEDVGEVEDLLVGADGRVAAVVIGPDTLLGLGAGAFAVPLERIEGGVIGDRPSIRIPVTADETDTLFGPDLAADLPEDNAPYWRVQARIGAEVVVEDGPSPSLLGRVDDFALKDGRLVAVIVAAPEGAGPSWKRAFPYAGQGPDWAPGEGRFSLPMSRQEALATPEFDYDRLVAR
ncbi:PRC-barrel domain-containing protein [Chthonobacter rhizosphaerae]|uniref:PRC-barrel domain-containing protein n=1 Tax=Chthonobacter rhizosphaerae TaxID=2735553 RepID=UPI0015EE8846|nr:PRC-barrel domain-containing protein [Chthonobacter rhizosphaerae]